MNSFKNLKIVFALVLSSIILSSCNGKFPGADARKYPDDPKLRVKKNLEEGRGFKLSDTFGKSRGGVFEFASSNELWRASLDTIDFMPLASVNYSGGIIITDWYSNDENSNESLEQFVTNKMELDKLKEKDGYLIQKSNPIYLDPYDKSFFNSHFYTPQKRLFGMYIDTFWANILVVWLMTLILI